MRRLAAASIKISGPSKLPNIRNMGTYRVPERPLYYRNPTKAELWAFQNRDLKNQLLVGLYFRASNT
jgi:hypothetical protein